MNIWWIRRDLRLIDNQAFSLALMGDDSVVPIFILDPALCNSPRVSRKRFAFLLDGLRVLDKDLQSRGSRLIIRKGKPAEVLATLMEESGATALFAEEDYTPYARRRDADVARTLPLHLVPGLTVHHPDKIKKANGQPYTVFTPFSRTWQELPLPNWKGVQLPDRIVTPVGINTLHLPDVPALTLSFRAGEQEAQIRLRTFLEENVLNYHQSRNRPDLNMTSQLSPYLRFGMVSARQAISAALEAIRQSDSESSRQGAKTWLNELIWREFFHGILYHFPHVHAISFRETYHSINWINDPDNFASWKAGQTGYPIVDAAMRQLRQIGWIHNRARMITASFLTKDLLIDWRWGEQYFMQHLIDGDLASNNGGWQWSAGTGTDATPYFRIFNPIIQGKKFDPNGVFVRRWVPELHKVAVQYIHEPWTMPLDIQKQAGCVIGKDYPTPVIEHQWARQRALHFYQKAFYEHKTLP